MNCDHEKYIPEGESSNWTVMTRERHGEKHHIHMCKKCNGLYWTEELAINPAILEFQYKMDNILFNLRGLDLNRDEAKLINEIRNKINSELSVLTVRYWDD